MDPEILEVIKQMSTSPGASELTINNVTQSLSFILPEQYTNFIKFSNGAGGFIGEDKYLIIYPIEDLSSANKELPVKDLSRQLGISLLIIGSDGSDLYYGFKQNSEGTTVVSVDFYESATESIDFHANTFNEFLKLLSQG